MGGVDRSAADVLGNQHDSERWQETVDEILPSLMDKQTETLWPRDTLFDYLQALERLQENVKEYQELQHMAAVALMQIYDT